MTLYAPSWMQNGSYSATLDRQLADALWTGGGVVGVGDLLVSQHAAGANMSVDVAAGHIVVPGNDNAGQGKYLCWSYAVTNVTIATAPGTGLSRLDLIVAQVRDSDQNGGANDDWIITAVTGTASASPSYPSPPASSLIIAGIAVGANVTSIVTANITDSRARAVLMNANSTYKAAAYRNAAWSAATSLTVIPFDTEDYDPGNCFSTSTHLYTCKRTGLYSVKGMWELSTTVSPNTGGISIIKNGSEYARGTGGSFGSGINVEFTVEADVPLTAGDTCGVAQICNGGTTFTSRLGARCSFSLLSD